MTSSITMARPYAQALFTHARQQQLLELWARALEVLAAVVRNHSAGTLLEDPRLGPIERQRLLLDCVRATLGEKTTALGDSLSSWIHVLVEEKRWILSPEIESLYHQFVMAHQGVVAVTIASAFPLSQGHREQFKQGLEKRLRSAVILQFIKDEQLIGGAVVQIGNQVIDGSIRGKLAKLAESLQV